MYHQMANRGIVNVDASQVALLDVLETLHEKLDGYVPRGSGEEVAEKEGGGSLGFFRNFGLDIFGSSASKDDKGDSRLAKYGDDDANCASPEGVYIYGSVGCGKTFVMDLFYECAPLPSDRKRRIHFHKFMLEVHGKMHEIYQKQGYKGDPIPQIAKDLASNAWLLCFDEFQVTDVADALVMRRLFSEMFQFGTVVVATSNRPPDDLYYNGIQRHLFLPFIGELKKRCVVHDMDSAFDYRLSGQASKDLYYVIPNLTQSGVDDDDDDEIAKSEAKQNLEKFDRLFHRLCREEIDTGSTIQTSTGREVTIPMSGKYTKVARFSFDDLCAKPLGAADFVEIAATFHTIFLEKVPVLNLSHINQMRRLITLVDTLYDRRTKLIVSAEAEPTLLFDEDNKGSSGGRDRESTDPRGDLLGSQEYVPAAQDEAFAWARTASRLIEMQSQEYVHRVHGKMDASEYLYPIQLQAMSTADVDKLWDRYDADRNGFIDDDEFQIMVEELLTVKKGPLGALAVTEEVMDAARAEILAKNGSMDEPSFRDFVKVFTTSNAA
eukprot:g3230.t1